MESAKNKKKYQLVLSAISTGLVLGITVLIIEFSFGALIFSGPLAPYFPNAIALTFLGSIVIGLVIAFGSRLPGTIGLPQDAPVAILAVAAASIADSMSSELSDDSLYYTVLAFIMVTSFLTGLSFIILGRLKFGDFVRYIPFPVFGGFLAGTGWFLVSGGISTMVDISVSFASLPNLFSIILLPQWGLGALVGIIALVYVRRTGQPYSLITVMLISIILFYIIFLFSGQSIAETQSQGWLFNLEANSVRLKPMTREGLNQVAWKEVISQIGNAGSLVVVSVIGLLLNASGIELIAKRDIDLNRELEINGWANILASFGGSPTGYDTLSLSALSFQTGKYSRLTALITTGVISIAFIFGSKILIFFPKIILGGILIFIGLNFLYTWLIETFRTLPLVEYALVILIFFVIVFIGFSEGLIVGTLASIILFVVNYSQVSVIRHIFDGQIYHSQLDRPRPEINLLSKNGESIYILELHGYLFFGSAHKIYEEIKSRVFNKEKSAVRYLVIGFAQVSRVDSSALHSFNKIILLAEKNGINISFANLSDRLTQLLLRDGINPRNYNNILFHPNIDRGVEWCENHLLADLGYQKEDVTITIDQIFAQILGEEVDNIEFLKYLERIEYDALTDIIIKGEVLDYLYIIGKGLVTAYFEEEDGDQLRLRTMHEGTIIGELSFYLGHPATASVSTEVPTTVFRLSKEKLHEMEKDHPELASAFNRLIIRLLGERLANVTSLLDVMK